MSVRVSPISRGAAILIVIVGVITFFLVDAFGGVAFIALGVALYVLLYRFRSKLEADLRRAEA